ncbi:MAG: VOC family protein [Alphaproteobacteria bacterium]
MKIQSLGHVVLKVRNQQRAEAFYNGVLGLPICARYDQMRMTFFSLGNHHDFAIAAVGDEAPLPDNGTVGLAHVAFKIGDDVATLRRARDELAAAGVETIAADHGVSKSLYFSDPDGNRVEVYVDQSQEWRRDPQLVAAYTPLEL